MRFIESIPCVCGFDEDRGDAVEIILLAFAAAFFPALLACVAIMISRPEPRWLLIGFYAGGLLTSIGTGIAVLALFDDGEGALGGTRSAPYPRLRSLLAWSRCCSRG